MTLFDDKYYIIRKGDFATNGNTKILYSLFSIGLCIEEYINANSTDCFSIMIGSTIVWTIIEFFLQVTSTRNIKPMYITTFYGQQIYLHKYLGMFLQGFQEGGVVTTIGLYFGDRLFDYHYLYMFHGLILFIIVSMFFKNSNSNNNNLSKRQINTSSSLGMMGTITIYNVKTLYDNPMHLQRQLTMFFAMIYISSIWTLMAYWKNFRNVEVQIKDRNDQYVVKPYNKFDAFLILGYDVIFEIGVAYLTFYNWFIL
jgi:hypothetical protein